MKRGPWYAWMGAGLVATGIWLACYSYLDTRREDARLNQQALARSLASLQAFNVQQQLARSLSSVYALAAVLRQYGTVQDFARLAAELVDAFGGLSGLQLAPRGIVRQIHPLAGNEQAIGHNLLEDPRRREAALEAIRTRRLTLAGPLKLIQGGQAVIARLPVFGVGEQPEDAFWGFAIALVRLPMLLESIDLDQLVKSGYDYELASDQGPNGADSLIVRSAASPLQEPVVVHFAVPNGSWSIAVAARGGWPAPPKPLGLFTVAALVALCGGWFTYFLLARPYLLATQVAERRGQLLVANRALDETLQERQRIAEELKRGESRYRMLIEYAGEAIIVHDAEGRLLEVNRAARELLDRDLDEIASFQVGDLFAALPVAEPEGLVHAGAGKPVALLRADGTKIPASLRTAAVDVAPGRVFITFLEDLSGRLANESALESTHRHLEARVKERNAELARVNASLTAELEERRRVEDALIEAKRAAELATQAKARFLANLSHEIRTPMNGLVGMLSLLAEEPLASAAAAGVRSALDSGRTLLLLLDDLLDLARIEAGGLVIEPLPTSIAAWSTEIEESFRERAATRGLVLRWELDGWVPETLQIDPHRSRQILVNLVDNALKFTEAGSVHVAIGYADGAHGERLQIEVTDTGPGIPEANRDRLFEAFTKADASLTRRHGGIGLGLALCQQLVQLMGGRLSMHSEVGMGSRFGVSLPTARVTEQGTPGVAAPRGAARGRVALVVDDDAVSRRVATAMLSKEGWIVDAVADGEAALEETAGKRFDLLLMDLHMPGIDGFETVRRLRARDSAGPVVIGCSGADGAEAVRACLAAGMDAHLLKPLQPETLRRTLQRWWGSAGPARDKSV